MKAVNIFSQHVEEIKKALPYYDQLFDWMDKQKPFSFAGKQEVSPYPFLSYPLVSQFLFSYFYSIYTLTRIQ